MNQKSNQRADTRDLIVCDNIVKRMKGSLQFVSTVGSGTTGSVALPLQLTFDPIHLVPSSTSQPRHIRYISDELNLLLSPRRPSTCGSSPLILGETISEIVPEQELCPAIQRTINVEADFVPLVLVVDDNVIARYAFSSSFSSLRLN